MQIKYKLGDIVTFDRVAWALYNETVIGTIDQIITNKAGTYLVYRVVDRRNRLFKYYHVTQDNLKLSPNG